MDHLPSAVSSEHCFPPLTKIISKRPKLWITLSYWQHVWGGCTQDIDSLSLDESTGARLAFLSATTMHVNKRLLTTTISKQVEFYKASKMTPSYYLKRFRLILTRQARLAYLWRGLANVCRNYKWTLLWCKQWRCTSSQHWTSTYSTAFLTIYFSGSQIFNCWFKIFFTAPSLRQDRHSLAWISITPLHSIRHH